MTESTRAVTAPAQHARRRRRRWPWVLLTVVVVLALLAAAAEILARTLAPTIIRDRVVAALDLPADQQIEVHTQGFHLGQLIGGRLSSVRLSTDSLSLGGLTGSLEATASGVPLDGSAIDEIAGALRMSPDQLLALLSQAELPLEEVRFDEGLITLAGEIRVLGIGIPIAISVEPGIAEGNIALSPSAFELGSMRLEADQLIEQLGSAGAALAGPFPVCLADRMPRAIELQWIDVATDLVEIGFRIDGAITVDPVLRQPGTCD